MGEWSIPRVCKTLARKGFESSNLSASILWEIVKDEVENFNGYWDNNLNVQFGYGYIVN